MDQNLPSFWSISAIELLDKLQVTAAGLTTNQAKKRLAIFGKVSERLKLKVPETEFERGIRRFGYFLGEVTLVLVVIIFAINVYLQRPVLESFLFSLALAVGLTPQLLPAIISINLAHGAKKMAQKKVIVKRLASIENFGSMSIICSDKTGTLTEGTVQVESAIDVNGNASEKVFLFAYLNAFYETGFTNPIDAAILNYRKVDLSGYEKHDEIPYDFFRKRLSIAVTLGNAYLMVTKGALTNILDVCSSVETKEGNVVGYMGDGINDASTLHAADVGISVDTAADVAKDAADIVLLEKDLSVLIEGLREGRTTFANTLKYVFMATSANFGNMFSMAISTDNVDDEMVDHPRRWDIKAIRKFMITFGLVSSVFDYLTFGLLLLVLRANEGQFRTGWFIESVISASMIVLVIRSRRPFFKSRPGKYLLIATLTIAFATLVLPFTPLGTVFGFSPLSLTTYLLLMLIVALYIIAAEITKTIFYKRVKF